jgi:hypothetical protein
MITLNTIIYEGNYNDFLNEKTWFFTFNSKYITKKLITVNNLESIDLFNEKINTLKKIYDFDIVFVNDYIDDVKKEFNLELNQTDVGYYYTIPYFVSLLNYTTEYFLTVATDCMSIISVGDDFFENSFNELNQNEICLTTTINWMNDEKVPEVEETDTFKKINRTYIPSKNFFIRYNFTDQFFLGKTKKLKNLNYNVSEWSSQYYLGPSYCGGCYEKRMVAIHVENNYYNLVYKGKYHYRHL